MAESDQHQGVSGGEAAGLDASGAGAASTVVVDPTFRSVAESLSDNIMLLDPEGVVRYTNNTVPDLTVEQVLGTHVYGYVPDEFRGIMRRCHERVLASGRPDRYETAYSSETGEISWWETRVSPVLRDGRVVALVQIASNVTERTQAAADRDRLFNLSVDMLCIAGTDGFFKRINPAVVHTLGHSEEELLAKPFLDFVHPDDRADTTAAVQRLGAGQQVIDFANRYRCRDGSYRWISWRSAPDSTGTLIHAVGRDVTEQRRLEEQLRHSQKMEAVGRLAGGIAHDFNNLLLAIDLNLDLMARAGDIARRDHFAGEARHATQRAADLTRQLLALGRKAQAELELLDVNAVVQGMLTLVGRLIGENIEIDVDLAESLPPVRADAAQLEQVVLNLCLNARDAMPEGGRLSIATRLTAADAVSGARAGDGDWVALRVTDSGIGMSPEVRERAFEPFFTTKSKGKGTGLGLATVYGVVEQHGGSVRVESELGRGATFEVLLPAAAGTPALPAPRSGPPALGGQETVLLAEDEAGVRDAVVALLEGAGYRVLVANDGEEAVVLFERHAAEVAVVLFDVVMPRLGGPVAALRIRALAPETPVILSSGYDHAAEIGIAAVPRALRLDKPYSPQALLRVIREAIESGPGTRPAA
jgi:PAS domain S-box-containing protein